MEHISILHGNLDNNDYAQLITMLTSAMTTADTISGIVAHNRQIHEQFQNSNQPLSDYQKCTYFRNAIHHHQHMRSAYESYVIATLLIGVQSFATLTTHVIQQAPNYTATPAELGYAANVMPPVPEYFQSAAFAALLTKTVQHAVAPGAATQKKWAAELKNLHTTATSTVIITRTVVAAVSKCSQTAPATRMRT